MKANDKETEVNEEDEKNERKIKMKQKYKRVSKNLVLRQRIND